MQQLSVDGAGPKAQWEASSIEVHHEQKEGPFRHGAPLGGCVASMANISDAEPLNHCLAQAAIANAPQQAHDQQ